MRNLAALLTALALVPGVGRSQNRTNQFTQPHLPESTELDRVNLKVGFATTLPIDGKKDGVATVQLFDDLLVVQMRSGTVAVYNAANGVLKWSNRPGQPYPPLVQNVAVDDRYLITIRDVRMYAYGRNGGQLEWMYELSTIPSSPPASDGYQVYLTIGGKQVSAFQLPLRAAVTGPTDGLVVATKEKPATKEKEPDKIPPANVKPQESLNLATTGSGKPLPPSLGGNTGAPSIAVLESVIPPYRLNSNTRQNTASLAVLPSAVPPYRLNSEVQATPDLTVVRDITRLDELSQKNLPALALKKAWVLTMGVRVNQTPLLAGSGVVFASTGNEVLASSRYVAQEMFHLETSGTISAGLAQYGDTVYVPLSDASLLAVEATRGRTLWRFTADSGILSKPDVIGNDIFVVSLMGQLYRVDRETGESAWKDSHGNEKFVSGIRSFVAANDRHVYAIDSAGQLAIIDRARGEVLHRLNTSDYTYAMANDETDRVYLAANSGSLVCLHDRSIMNPKAHPKAKATGTTNKGDGANDLFKLSDPNKKRPADFPGSKADKAGDDKSGDDKPMDDKPKAKPKKPKGKPKDDMPKDDK